MKSKTVEIDRFHALSDSGKEYTIIVFQDLLDASTMDNIEEEIPGRKRMKTSTGMPINFIDSNNFVIALTGEHLHKA